LQPAPVQLQLPPGQLTVQVAPSGQVVEQPPPMHETVQVEPAAHVVEQLPPTHETEHLAAAAQSVAHRPLRQLNEQSLPAAQLAAQPLPSPQLSSHFAAAGHWHVVPVQEPAPPEDEVEESVPPSFAPVPVPSVKSYVHAVTRDSRRAAARARIELHHRARRSPGAQTGKIRRFTASGASAVVPAHARSPPAASRATLAGANFAKLPPAPIAQTEC